MNEIPKLPKLELKMDLSDAGNEITKNALSAPAKSTGGIISTTLDFIHNTVFLPMQQYNLYAKAKLDDFELELNNRTSQIPQEKLVESSVNILGPTVEGLKYNLDEEHIKNMFMNILLADMNTDTKNKVLPAYVEIVKQLSPLDAVVFKKINDLKKTIMCARITFNILNSTKYYPNATPDLFVIELCDLADPFEISSSLQNLERLKLISIFENGVKGENYDIFKENKYVITQFEHMQKIHTEIEMKIVEKAILTNNFGRTFAQICL
jgi:hypothetical protein